MIIMARDKLRRLETKMLDRMSRAHINRDVNWEGVQTLAGLEEAFTTICGEPAPTADFLETRRWEKPPPPPPGKKVKGGFELVSSIYGKISTRAAKWSRRAQSLNKWRL